MGASKGKDRFALPLLVLVIMMLAAPFHPLMSVGGAGQDEGASPSSSRDTNIPGTLWGFVSDIDGVPLVNAKIELWAESNYSLKRTAFSQQGGYYTIDLQADSYRVRVTKASYFDINTVIKVHRGEAVRHDFVMEMIPPITSTITGTVTDYDTSNPIGLVTVIIYDFARNYTFFDVTNMLGRYTIDIYEGLFLLTASKTGYLPKYIGGINVGDGETKTLDIELYPEPPIDARVIGDVTYKLDDGKSGPVPWAIIMIFDLVKGFTVTTEADDTGHFDFYLYEGTFLFFIYTENNSIVDAIPRNVTTSSAQVTVEDFALPELPPSESVNNVYLSDWDDGYVEFEASTWGRGEGSGTPMKFIRLLVDIYFGNGDLYADESEVDPLLQFLETELRNEFGIYDTKEYFLLDGVEFVFDESFEIVDVDATGHVFSNKPQTLGFRINATANQTIDKGQPVHDLYFNQSYATENTTEEVFMTFPSGFTMRALSASENMMVDVLPDGRIHVVPAMDPDPSDGIRGESFTFEMADSIMPIADAGGNITAEEDSPVTFDASASSDNFDIAYYLWDFGDGNTTNVTIETVMHTYDEPGNYTVGLVVGDPVSNEAGTSIWVDVLDVTPPTVTISVDNTTVPEDMTINFEAEASDNVAIHNITWLLMGDTVGTGPMLDHVFAEPGRYTVEAVALDTSLIPSNATVTMTVTDETAPTAVAGNDTTVNESQEVVFDAGASADNVGIISFSWNFGDGSSNVTGEVSTHKFDTPGSYTVTLTIRDAAGHGASDTLVVTVLDITSPTTVLNGKTSVDLGKKVTLNATGSIDNVGIVDYTWNLGDGTVLNGMEVTHKYKKAGNFEVLLTTRDAAGNEDNTTMTIRVYEPDNPVLNLFCVSSILVAVFLGGIGSYLLYRRLKLGGYKVDEVFVIYQDGRLIRHVSAHPIGTVDKQVIASMLTAVQEFVKDSLQKEGEFLGKIEYGKKTKILIEKGNKVYLAVVLTGHDPESLRNTLAKMVREIEKDYAKKLKRWDGDSSKFEGLDEMVIELMEK